MTREEELERGEKLRTVAEHLKGKSCVYGEDDCSMVPLQWVLDWNRHRHSREFEISYPAYASRDEAETVIEAAGGLVNVWRAVARQVGLTEHYQNPEIGDIGIIETRLGQVGGIFLHGGAILWRAEQGVRVIGVRPRLIVKMWRMA